ncbi:uncharacterized protein EDB93DRAFT_1246526 [Suillus bovinus]|uniref:uncharacterized protein n=1 Tax=Suillus bovinus TaxID=48563 RepID=UPI001B873AE4|nr:uncharacterized protein EDB93DRAFT_1246526 [Suillus bovinus]KAG2158034.1 hypothetical protein EDB93DRAFT_1246526 [Suillus bovinus]
MSAPVDTSLTSLKEITAKIMAIITSAWQLPLGHSHFSLTTQVSTLMADAVRQYGSGPYLLGLVCLCSRELICVRGMTPQVWPNWHSIGYNDTHLLMHPWCSKVLAWEELGDHTFDLPVVSGPSVDPIPVDLPPSPVIAGPSTNPASKSWEKGKGKAVVPDLEPEVEGSRKRKSPMIPALPSQPPKSAMKTQKRAKTTGLAKFKVFVESEDEEDLVTQVILPRLSPDVARTSGSPRSPRSPKKKPFGPATAIAGKCPEVIEPAQATPEPPVEASPVIDTGDILIPRPISTPLRLEDRRPMHVLHLLHHQEDQVHLREYGNPAETCLRSIRHLDHQEDQIQDPFQSSLQSSGRLTNHRPDAESISGLFHHSCLIDLSMEGMEPNPPNLQDESAIDGLIFELNQIHPEVSQMPGKIVKPDDPGNLFPEYDSVEEMDVQVKGEPSGEDVDMTT